MVEGSVELTLALVRDFLRRAAKNAKNSLKDVKHKTKQYPLAT